MFNLNQPAAAPWKFLVNFAVLFVLFYSFNLLYISLTTPGGLYIPFLAQHFNYIKIWREFCIMSTAKVLDFMGYVIQVTETTLKVQGHAGFRLVYSCLGYGIMSFFAAFTLAFPKPLRSRIVFLFSGLLAIQCLNTLRFILIALFYQPKPILFFADHHDAFNYTLYGILLAMIWFWLNSSNKHALAIETCPPCSVTENIDPD